MVLSCRGYCSFQIIQPEKNVLGNLRHTLIGSFSMIFVCWRNIPSSKPQKMVMIDTRRLAFVWDLSCRWLYVIMEAALEQSRIDIIHTFSANFYLPEEPSKANCYLHVKLMSYKDMLFEVNVHLIVNQECTIH